MAVGCEQFSLEKPSSFDNNSSNICIKVLNNDKIIVGNECGCFISTLFHQANELKLFNNKEVPALCGGFPNNEEDGHGEGSNIFYVGTENSIFKFDLRCSLDKEIISFSENIEDINQIVINESGLLASCDDSGECKIIDTRQNKLFRTLRNRHKNICSTLSFMPSRPEDIVTGGLDSQILVWNYTNVRLTQTLNTQDILEKLGDNSVKMFNPPLVNSIEISNDGKLCAAGLGNGTLQLFHILKGKNVLAPSHVINRHTSVGVSNVHFIKQSETSYMLASGGNDCDINVWEIPVIAPPASKKSRQVIPPNNVLDDSEIEDLIKYKIKLDSKINFLSSSFRDGKGTLFCADQTPIVKGYILPQ